MIGQVFSVAFDCLTRMRWPGSRRTCWGVALAWMGSIGPA